MENDNYLAEEIDLDSPAETLNVQKDTETPAEVYRWEAVGSIG